MDMGGGVGPISRDPSLVCGYGMRGLTAGHSYGLLLWDGALLILACHLGYIYGSSLSSCKTHGHRLWE